MSIYLFRMAFIQNELLGNMTEHMLFNHMKELRRIAGAGDIQVTTAMMWTMLSLHQTGLLPVSSVSIVVINQWNHKIV